MVNGIMHIGYFLQNAAPVYGAERATLMLAQAMRDTPGVRVTAYLMDEQRRPLSLRPTLADAFMEAGIAVRMLPVAHPFSPALIRSLRAALRDDGIDVLHTIGYKADLHGSRACRGNHRVPVVSTVHGWLFRPDPKERFYGWLNIRTLRRFSRVIVLSRFYETYLRQQGLQAPQVVRIPSGYAAPATLPERPPARRPFTIGILGRLSSEKNHALFLRVCAHLRNRGTPLCARIAGTGPEADTIRDTLVARGLADSVELCGYTASTVFLKEIDALLSCSHIENLPYSVLEAMAAGVPVIATAVGGLPDLIDDGVTGFLVPADDAATMADRVCTLAADDSVYRQMAQAAHAKLATDFSPERQRSAHLDLYKGLCP
jgi:glycosyltransferase involved in cell wall biosynthesis